MDIKTLEYMEERAKNARRIVEKIGKLQKNIESIKNIKRVDFINSRFNQEFDSSIGCLTEQMKTAYVQVAEEEIVLLEQELAEL